MPADDGAGDRTEEATPRRREQERERGQVAKSRDLSAAISLIGAILLLRYGGHVVAWLFHGYVKSILGPGGRMATSPTPDGMDVFPVVLESLWWFTVSTLPLLAGIFLVAAVANYGQVGFLFATKALEPKLDKLNPVSGFQRMFSLRSLITLVMSASKVALMFVIAFPVIHAEFDVVSQLVHQDTNQIYVYTVEAVLRLALYLACLLIVLGVLDYAYQRYQQSQDMKMTKQQIKQEARDDQGSPEVMQRRRQLQRQLAQQRMMQEVPKADVVIRNPTHFAVALRYDEKKHAPWVVAKGTDHLAFRIIDLAVAHKVPVIEDRPLARKMYATLELGDFIPEELYDAVAAILGHAYRLKYPRGLPRPVRRDPEPAARAAGTGTEAEKRLGAAARRRRPVSAGRVPDGTNR